MKVGFTGTRQGMTEAQRICFGAALVLLTEERDEFHHGDCIGADAEAHRLATEFGYKAIIHPPIIGSKRAFCNAPVVLQAKPYLERNHDIVDAVDFMFATPGEINEQLRSGTWATIRYARKKQKKLMIIGPDGNVHENT